VRVPSAAIENEGGIFLRRVSVSGYAKSLADHGAATLTGTIAEFASPPAKPGAKNLARSLDLAIEEPPEAFNPEPSEWLSVVAKGADPTGRSDSTQAIQLALDSDAPVVYFPVGLYEITDTIHIRKGTRRLLGPSATLVPRSAKFADAQNPAPVLRFESQTADLAIEGLSFGNFHDEVLSRRSDDRRCVAAHPHLAPSRDGERLSRRLCDRQRRNRARLYRGRRGGTVVLPWAAKNMGATTRHGVSVGEKAVVDGAQLWVMGVKTERPGTVIRAENGAALEVLGGLLYPLATMPPDQAAFVIDNARASLTYAVEAFGPWQELRHPGRGIEKRQGRPARHGVHRARLWLLPVSLSRGQLTRLRCRGVIARRFADWAKLVRQLDLLRHGLGWAGVQTITV
jgi:hypothetical protein